jgi:probable phosphomutase (TIGR03848 family)
MGIAVLLRHGHSTANAKSLLTGRLPGVLLSDSGEQQARDLAPAFSALTPASVSVSPLERTQQTARLVFGQREFINEVGIIECDYGDWSGRDLKELAEEPLWRDVQSSPSTVRFPNGERLIDMASRSVRTVRERCTDGGVHVFVSHGDIIKAVVSDACGARFDDFQRIVVDPCSISLIAYGEQVRLLAVNIPITGAAAALEGIAKSDRGTVGGGGGTA